MGVSWLTALGLVPQDTIRELMTGGLSFGVYTNLASTFINKDIGWSQATGIIRQLFPDFSGSAFGDVYYKQYQIITQKNYIQETDPYSPVDHDSLIERALHEPVKYRYIGEFTYINDVTGDTEKEYKSYYSNQELSIAEAGEYVFNSFHQDNYKDWRQIESVRIVNVEHNEGWEY